MFGAVKHLEAGPSAKTVARTRHHRPDAVHNWRLTRSGLDVHEERRLKELEDENRRLKTMVADLSLDAPTLSERATGFKFPLIRVKNHE
jgi:putative transposase